MAEIKIYGELKNETPNGYVARTTQIMDVGEGKLQSQVNQELKEGDNILEANTSYVICDSVADEPNKLITLSDFVLSTSIRILVKFIHANTVDNITLNINNTGAKSIWYDGAAAGAANSWEDGEVVDLYYDGSKYLSNSGGGGTFATGEKVSEVSIDNTNLTNPKDGALPTAADVMQLKAKLEGVTMEETKVILVENTNWFANYKVNETGKIVSASGSTTSPANAIFITQVTGYSKVRVLGSQTSGNSITLGYGFTVESIDTSAMTDLQLDVSSTFITNAESSGQHEYLIDVPDGMNYLVFTIHRYNGTVPIEQFYCYLQSGECVGDFIKETEPIINDCEKAYNNLQFGYSPTGEPITETNVFAGYRIGVDGRIGSGQGEIWKIYCYPTSPEDRWLYVDELLKGTSSIPTGGVYLIDDISFIAHNNIIPSEDILNAPSSQSDRVLQKLFFVPANRILVVTHSTYNPGSFLNVYETELSSEVINDIQDDIIELQEKTAGLPELEETVDQIKEKTDLLEETDVYTDISSSIMTVDENLGIPGNTNKISSTTQSYWKMRYFQARINDWKLRVKVVCGTQQLSYKIGQVFLVDSVSEIAAGYTTIPLVTGIYKSSSSPIDTIIDVPAGKIVVISTTTYYVPNSNSFEYYEVIKTLEFLDDIEQLQNDVTELRDNLDPIVVSIINDNLSIDSIPSQTNPLKVVKETAGYTSIFRTIGIIGGSMSSGTIYPGGSPEYSQIQYIARLCGSEGHNFGRGGMSAINWPKSDQIEGANEFKANPTSMYIIQLGNNDSTYNSEHPEYVIGDVTQVNGIDGTGTVPDVVNISSSGTAAVYPNYAVTFCGQIGKILACIRKVSPKAHVFLSTFIKGYGSNTNFNYNQAIRDIYEYLSNSDNTPEGDTLKYHLIDYETYGTPYSSYTNSSNTIHKGTISSSHLMATGYLLWAYEYCTYIDWIIKNNMANFNDVSAITKKIIYDLDGITIDSVTVNGMSLNTDYLPNYVSYGGSIVLHLTAETSINNVKVYSGDGHARRDITNSSWDSQTQTITISSVENLITITAKAV